MANPKNTSTRLKYCKSHSTAPDVKRRKKGGKEEGKEGRKTIEEKPILLTPIE